MVEVGGEERGNVVLACRRVEKVARERGVEDEALDGKTVFKQRALEVFDVVADLFDIGRKERAQECVPVAFIAAEIELGGENTAVPRIALDDHAREVGQREERDVLRFAEKREQLVRARFRAHDLSRHGEVLRRFGGGVAGGRLEAVFFDELCELELHKERIERIRRGLAQVFLRGEFERRVGDDGCKIKALAGALFPLGELFDDVRLCLDIRQQTVDLVDALIFPDERRRCLFPHAGNAGDVVARVAHQRLEVDDVDGREAVAFEKRLRRHVLRRGLAHARGDELDGRVLGDELERVLVSRGDDAVPALFFALARDRADEVVRFKADELIAGDVHRVEHVLQIGDLHGEFLGHGMARGLVALVFQVTEGRLAAVEGDAERLGLFLIHKAREHREKAEDRVGEKTVARRERTNAVIGAVDDGVAVKHHQFHGKHLPKCKFLLNIV